jgi:pseudolysin/vibriolysin
MGAPRVSVGRSELRDAPATAAARITHPDPTTNALAFVRRERSALGVNAHSDFTLLRHHVDRAGGNHVRLQQTYDGVKIHGADIVVHSNDDAVTAVDGKLLTALQALDLAPDLSPDSALGIAHDAIGKEAPEALAYQPETNELEILPLADGSARLVWHVVVFTPGQVGVKTARWNYFVDAHDGSVVKSWNALHTAVVQASGKGGNPRVPRSWTTLDVTPNAAGTKWTMNTAQYETKSATTNADISDTTITDFASKDPSANDAHGYAEVTMQMMKDWHGLNSIDDMGFKILSIVHVTQFGQPMSNAYWDGKKMSYGDGDNRNFYQFTGALDVIGHEINHGFTSFHSNLDYDGPAGGMNESFSDIAGTSAKFYFEPDSATFDLGGDIWVKPGNYIRWMCTPSKDGQSIDDASDYTQGLDVHFSSGVMNRAFCHAAKRLSGVDPKADDKNATVAGLKRASQAWYHANAGFWTSSIDFAGGCKGVIAAATDLKFTPAEISAIGDSWKDVGVTCAYTHVEDFGMTLTPDKATAQAGSTVTFTVATTLAAGATAQSVALTVSGLTGGLTGTFAPSSIMSGGTSMLTVTIPVTAPEGDVKLTVTATGATAGAKTADATITVTAPPPPPDMAMGGGGSGGGNGGSGGGGGGGGGSGGTGGGSGSGDPPGGGWGCSMSDSGPGAGLPILLLAFAALVVLRRRRA